jgi:hypothetical protein
MAIWNVKFDHKNGELRKCKVCDKDFHTKKPVWRCMACINANQKIVEKKKRAKYEKKTIYPFSNKTSEASNRFCSIRTRLSNAWKEYRETGDRSIITQHYEKQLKEIEELGILKWIIDRRDKETADSKQSKSRRNIQKDYPNHHDYYEY